MIGISQMGAQLASLMKQKVTQKVVDWFTGAGGDSSLIQGGSWTEIVIPMIVTNDIPKDTALSLAKSAELKIAYDVKRYLEMMIADSPKDVNIKKVMKDLPVTVIKKGPLLNTDWIFDKLAAANIDVNNPLDEMYKESLDIKIMRGALSDTKDKLSDVELYSEADGVIRDYRGMSTQLEVELKYVNKKAEIKTIKYYISVECTPRYVDETELMLRFSKLDIRRFYRQFVKLERKEISFVSDWMLELKELKAMAKNATKGRNNIFSIIDKYRLMNDMLVNVYPFLTIAVSKSFVDKLMDNEKMDLYKNADVILNKFFAMGMYIFTPETELLEIKYDGDPMFSTYTLDDIIKDSSKYERELKNLIKYNR